MKYNKTTVKQITDLIEADDYTITEICEIVGLSRDTFNTWKKTKSDFLDSIKKAEMLRFETFKKEARKGLMVLLKGKEFEEVTTEYAGGASDDPKATIKLQKTIKKFIMPNPTSIIFALKNVDPDYFRDVISNEISGRDGSPIDLNVGNIVFK